MRIHCTILLLLQIAVQSATCSFNISEVNSFEFNLLQAEVINNIPDLPQSKLDWRIWNSRRCFGCGRQSKITYRFVCVLQIISATTPQSLRKINSVFQVDESRCIKAGIPKPRPCRIQHSACGSPCDELKLIKYQTRQCYCDKNNNAQYMVPKLVCQNNRNRTVDLALCETLYKRRRHLYSATECPHSNLCQLKGKWQVGEWSKCSFEQPLRQWRSLQCVVQISNSSAKYPMHPMHCKDQERPKVEQFCPRWGINRWKCNCRTKLAYRYVLCYRYVLTEKYEKRFIILNETQCSSWHVKPKHSRECRDEELKQQCDIKPNLSSLGNLKPEWRVSDWSNCSYNQPIWQLRSVQCVVRVNKSSIEIRPAANCEQSKKPNVKRLCPRWASGIWEDCNCTTKMTVRLVVCYRYNLDENNQKELIFLNASECSWYKALEDKRVCSQLEFNEKCALKAEALNGTFSEGNDK